MNKLLANSDVSNINFITIWKQTWQYIQNDYNIFSDIFNSNLKTNMVIHTVPCNEGSHVTS